MPTALRKCTKPGCVEMDPSGRCPEHRAGDRKARGTTTQQGYGWAHQQRRKALLPTSPPLCPDCHQPLTPDRMVADHSTPLSTDRTSVADRVHCRRCSNRQGGLISHPGGRG